ncbi:hypothetical protein CcaCcLH18_03138 [Colletotrichum camelliae]|nr:hypothetical protein CcaCcLH18_03138 [Colletotrichum camelliae]
MSNFNFNTWSFDDLPFHPFYNLPAELQDEIYEVASATGPNQPQLRFVQFREHRTHNPNCPPFSSSCDCQNARYLTFHPLRRRDIANESSWHDLVHAEDSPAPDVQVASITGRSRDASDRLNLSNRFPQQQGDWSMTTVSTMTSAERAARRHTLRTFIGDATRCRTQDLVLVHFPNDRELRAIAVTMDNWQEQCYSHFLGEWLGAMADGHARSWNLLEQYGARNVADGNYPADWVTTGQTQGYVPWYPEHPQRTLKYDNNGGISNMRILHDIFTGLQELWFLDFDALHPDHNVNAIQRYRTTYKPRQHCQTCKYTHEGFPRVFGGVDAYDFMELRICDTGFNNKFAIRHNPQDFLDARRQLEMEWPHRDCHDQPWHRSKPVAKLLVPIPKMDY